MSGDVGMFWVDQGHLIRAAVPAADGIDDGQLVNGPDDHDPYWATVQRTPIHLWDIEYHQVPRGRVLFHKAEDRFHVYLDKVLCTATIKRLIIERFHFPRQQTAFRTDVHDTTDPETPTVCFPSNGRATQRRQPSMWGWVWPQETVETMATDQEIIEAVRHAFGAEPRPEHFTDQRHCCECAEHDALLASRDLESMRLEDVNNAGWDPICFVTAEGFRYSLPALVRLAFESATTDDWYLPQLLFHLTYDGPQNRRVVCCSAAQQQAIAAVLWHVLETRPALIVRYGIEDDLQRALEIWSAPES